MAAVSYTHLDVYKRQPLSKEEQLEVTKVYSVAGMLEEGTGLITDRPFVNPHHTITGHALTGGGRIPRPGVISLAHRGILFLDELTEFRRETLDLLRQPMEEHRVQIARSSEMCIRDRYYGGQGEQGNLHPYDGYRCTGRGGRGGVFRGRAVYPL